MLHTTYKTFLFVTFSLALSLLSVLSSAEEKEMSANEAQIASLIELFQSGKLSAKEVSKTVKWSGISDEALFDAMAERLPKSFTKRLYTTELKNTRWTLQALGASGLEKYKPILERAEQTSTQAKLMSEGTSALKFLEQFKTWNPIISAGINDVKLEDLTFARIKNMITSDDQTLVRAGASMISNRHYSEQRYIDLIIPEIEKDYAKVQHKSKRSDALAWMLKALGQTKDKKHLPLLKKVESDSSAKNLRRWARRTIVKMTGRKYRPE